MDRFQNMYDISVLLGEESIDYPGDTPYSRERLCTIRDGGAYELSRLVMSSHSGTHIDFPGHFIADGKTLDQYHIRTFMLAAQVVEIEDPELIGPAELKHLDIKQNGALLFKTENSRSGLCTTGTFSAGYVYLSADAAAFCVQKKVGLIGLDYITIEKFGDETFPAHRTILGNDIPILEGIHLKDVGPGKYTLICLPLKIKGGEASPVRAVLMR